MTMQSVQFSHPVFFDTLWPHGLQHTRLPCPLPTPGAWSNSCPSSWWCHPTILSSVIPFSSCLQSFPASGSFPMSQFFASGGQSTGVSVSASVLPRNIQDWFPLGLNSWISLQSKGLSRVLLSTGIQKHQFFGPALTSNMTTGKTIALTRWTFVTRWTEWLSTAQYPSQLLSNHCGRWRITVLGALIHICEVPWWSSG